MRTFLFLLLFSWGLQAQVYEFTTTDAEGSQLQHRILMDGEYIVETVYTKNPARFVKTLGGFYTRKGNKIEAQLEFNSNFENDQQKSMTWTPGEDWKKTSRPPLALNGKWLMAGRVNPEGGERRRDLNRPRKTMKFLVDGHFQWIAFNTESFAFFGSGGGSYTAAEGAYTENIEYFSRDNSRVGAALRFQYTQKGNDWYHKGKSSKGAPLHEIWSARKN
jgi:hypothetical protein